MTSRRSSAGSSALFNSSRSRRGARSETIQDRDPIAECRAWPYGWPCRVVHAPPPQQCPLLSDLVKEVYGPGAPFLPFVAPLRYAPMRLDQKMSRALERYFN